MWQRELTTTATKITAKVTNYVGDEKKTAKVERKQAATRTTTLNVVNYRKSERQTY